MTIENTELFLDEKRSKIVKEEESYLIRFLRKKWKCIMLWGFSILTVAQAFIIIFEKMDENLLNKALHSVFNKNQTCADITELNISIKRLSDLILCLKNSNFSSSASNNYPACFPD